MTSFPVFILSWKVRFFAVFSSCQINQHSVRQTKAVLHTAQHRWFRRYKLRDYRCTIDGGVAARMKACVLIHLWVAWIGRRKSLNSSRIFKLVESQAARQCSPVVMVTSGLNGATLFWTALYTKPMDRLKPKLAVITRVGTYIDLPNLVEIGSLWESPQ